jgi:hypothetical protein
MSIAVSVKNWKFAARDNSGGFRQGSGPQSATAYIFETLPAMLTAQLRQTIF